MGASKYIATVFAWGKGWVHSSFWTVQGRRQVSFTSCIFSKTFPQVPKDTEKWKDVVSEGDTEDLQNHSQTEEKISSLEVWSGEPQFPDLIHEAESKVGFWQTERGLEIKDQAWTGFGRIMRLFVSPEKYDNAWEKSETYRVFKPNRLNRFQSLLCEKHGHEWAAGYLVFRLGGALKLTTDDRWLSEHKSIRTPKRKDFTIEAIDLRTSMVNVHGLQYLEKLGYIRYLNFADCLLFDNACMSRLHPVADTLEYLDISGTQVTVEGFSYFRVFPHLKWLNISRLKNPLTVKNLLPFLLEILPLGCVVVCDDARKALAYGSPTAFRHHKNPAKDYIVKGNPGIGDVAVFKESYGDNALQLQDVSTVYELWKTPKVSKSRLTTLKINKPRPSFLATFAKYVKKAEKFPPIV